MRRNQAKAQVQPGRLFVFSRGPVRLIRQIGGVVLEACGFALGRSRSLFAVLTVCVESLG